MYTLRACRVGDTYGVYGRDMFNRSAYRRRLERQGVRFSAEPVTGFRLDGNFEDKRWGPFRADFSLLEGGDEDGEPIRIPGGLVSFTLASFRLGPIGSQELSALVRVTHSMISVGAAQPDAALEYVRNALES